jgi:hypothetical protein
MVDGMRSLLVALVVALIASGEAHAQVTTQPSGPGANFCAPQTLAFGAAPRAGTIASAGRVGCYRFDGAAGEKVRIRLIPTGGALDPAVTVGRPGGGVSCATTTQNDSTCVLDATGVHSITVADAAGTKTGHYAISIQRLNDPVGCGPALSYGGNAVAASLSVAGDSECHRFTAAAGDRVRVNWQATTIGLNPAVEVVKPDGTPLCGITGGPLTCTAPVAGTYTLLVRDPLPGSYGVSLQRLQSPVGCTTLTTGFGPHTRQLPAAGELRCFRVHEDAGALLRVRVIPTGGTLIPTAEVLRPDGTTRCAATAADDSTCTLDTGGHHTILVRDGGQSGTGSFTIALQRLDAPSGCATHQLGTLPAANLLYPGDVECHRFDAEAGDVVRIRVRARGATPSLRPAFELIRPGGTPDCSAADERSCLLASTGTYMVLVRDQSPGNRTGTYELTVQRLNDPVGCAAGAFGPDAESAELAGGETDCVRFEGVAGDRIRFRSVAVHAMDLVAEVIRPDGTTRCSRTAAASLTCELTTTGTHTILVRDATGERFGQHWWSIQRLDDPVGCMTLNSGLPPMVGGVGVAATPCWRFVGEEDEHVRLLVTDRWGDWKPYIEVIRPEGQTLGATTGTLTYFDSGWRLNDTGTHTVLLRDDGRGYDTGQYAIELRR